MQRKRNTSAMPILPMITLLHEFLIVSCVLCAPQVDSSLHQIKHCLSLVPYGKYNTQRMVSRRNIALGFASCYICLLPTLFMLYFPYSTRGSALSNINIYIYQEFLFNLCISIYNKYRIELTGNCDVLVSHSGGIRRITLTSNNH